MNIFQLIRTSYQEQDKIARHTERIVNPARNFLRQHIFRLPTEFADLLSEINVHNDFNYNKFVRSLDLCDWGKFLGHIENAVDFAESKTDLIWHVLSDLTLLHFMNKHLYYTMVINNSQNCECEDYFKFTGKKEYLQHEWPPEEKHHLASISWAMFINFIRSEEILTLLDSEKSREFRKLLRESTSFYTESPKLFCGLRSFLPEMQKRKNPLLW